MSLSPSRLWATASRVAFRFAAAIMATQLAVAATPTDQELRMALDDDAPGGWIIGEQAAGVKMEIVPVAGAMGGTALKVTVPADKSWSLERFIGEVSVYSFRYRLETASIAAEQRLTWSAFQGEGRIESQAPSNQWIEIGVEQAGSVVDGRLTLELETTVASSGDRVFYVDAVAIERGVLVRIDSFDAQVQIEPSQEVYQIGDWITLKAHPTNGATAFGAWSGLLGQDSSKPIIDLKVQGPTRLTARGADRFVFDGAALVTRRGEIEATSSGTGAGQLVTLSTANAYDTRWFYLESIEGGAGFLEYEIHQVEGKAGSVGEIEMQAEPIVVSTWVPADARMIEGSIRGSAAIGSLRKVAGFPVAVAISGRGSVAGVPQEGKAAPTGPIALLATPDEGWAFARWEGDHPGHAPTLEFTPRGPVSIKAVFTETLTLNGFNFLNYGDALWRLADFEGATALRLTDSLPPETAGKLELEVLGPGLLTIEFQASEGFATLSRSQSGLASFDPHLATEQLGALAPYSFALHGGLLPVELLPGLNRIEIASSNPTSEAFPQAIAITGLSLDAGYAIRAESGTGGSIEGLPDGRVEGGSPVRLVAVPDPGYAFERWTGTLQSPNPILEFSAERNLDLRAEFSRVIEADGLSWKVGGFTHWSRVDGKWQMPAVLDLGESSWIEADVEGEAFVSFGSNRSDVRGLYTKVGNALKSSQSADWQTWVPGGRWPLRLEALGREYYQPAAISVESIRYTVRFGTRYANIETVPELAPWADGKGYKAASLPAGTQLSYKLTPNAPGSEVRWTGDLEGQATEGTLTVEGPFDAYALVGNSSVSAGGLAWSIEEGMVAIANASDDGVALNAVSGDVVKVATTAVGPGTLRASIDAEFGSVEVYRDGEAVALSDFGSIDFPPGAHGVALVFRKKPGVADFPAFGLSYHSGVSAQTSTTAGGRLADEQNANGYFPRGTSVSATAMPNANNHFVGWEGTHPASSATFTSTLDQPLQMNARFEANAKLGDYAWQFEGVMPTCVNHPESPNKPYALRWYPGPAEENGIIIAKTSVQGPGNLRNHISGAFGGPFHLRALVDGVETELDRDSFAIGIASLYLEPGLHEISYEMDLSAMPQYPANGHSWLELTLPALERSYSIAVSGRDTAIAQNASYGSTYGSSIMATAPATNSSGNVFQGWWMMPRASVHSDDQLFPGTLLGAGPSLSAKVIRSASYLALYGPPSLQVSGLAFNTAGSRWAPALGVVAPNGGNCISSDGFGGGTGLQIVVKQDSVIRFWVKTKAATQTHMRLNAQTLTLRQDRNTFDALLASGTTDWHECAISLRAHEVLTLEASSGTTGNQCLIGGFSASPGWAPTIIRSDRVEIAWSGEVATLSVKDEHAEAFEYWAASNSQVPLTGATVEASRREMHTFEPRFSLLADTKWGTARLFPDLSWSKDPASPVGEEWFRFHRRGEPWVSLPVEGPAVLAYKISSGGGRDVFVNGEEAEEYFLFDTRYVNVPPGQRGFLLAHDHMVEDYDSSFKLVNVAKGRRNRPIHVEGGHVSWLPSGPAMLEGDYVQAVAIPDLGYEFVDWLPPYAGKSSRFNHVAVMDSLPVPIFGPAEAEASFDVNGREWRFGGLQFETEASPGEDGFVELVRIARPTGDEPGWIESEFEGPGVLSMPSHGGFSFSLDGIPVEELTSPAVIDDSHFGTLVPLGNGQHTLRAELTEDLGWIRAHALPRFSPGYLASIEVHGAFAMPRPQLPAYPPGSYVEVSILGVESAESLEWIGLPEGTEFEGPKLRVPIHEHVKAEAIAWRFQPLAGWNFRQGGGFAWSDVGDYALNDRATSGVPEFLELKPEKKGILHFKFEIDEVDFDPALLKSALLLNGLPVQLDRYRVERLEIFEGYVQIDPEDTLRWAFDQTRTAPSDTFRNRMLAMEMVEPHELSEFSRWFFLAEQGKALGIGPSLQSDKDGNGIGAFLEYALSAEAPMTKPLFGIRPSSARNGVEFYLDRAAWELGEAITIEVADSLEEQATWSNISDVLGDPVVPANTTISPFWPVEESRDKLFGRLKSEAPPVAPGSVFGSTR